MIIGNPYDQNHWLRVGGTLLCLTGTLVANFLLYYWRITEEQNESVWGVFFVRPVEGWRTWWYPAQDTVCKIADDKTVAESFTWGEKFLLAYEDADLDDLCGTLYNLMPLAFLACFATISFSVVVLVLVIVSRFRGDPEVSSHDYYDHCKPAIVFAAACMALIVVSALTFVVAFRASKIRPGIQPKVREGVFVVILSASFLGLVIFAYVRDRALLSTKFEFEKLEWRAGGDAKDEYRKRMQYDMRRLEAAKYGGLRTPYQMAREADAAAERALAYRGGQV